MLPVSPYYRQVLAERLGVCQRMQVHRRMGERLAQGYRPQTPTIATQLAHHFVQGRAPHRAVPYLHQAGAGSPALGVPRSAADHHQGWAARRITHRDVWTDPGAGPGEARHHQSEKWLQATVCLMYTLSLSLGAAPPQQGLCAPGSIRVGFGPGRANSSAGLGTKGRAAAGRPRTQPAMYRATCRLSFLSLEAIPNEEGNLFEVHLDTAAYGFGDKNPILVIDLDG